MNTNLHNNSTVIVVGFNSKISVAIRRVFVDYSDFKLIFLSSSLPFGESAIIEEHIVFGGNFTDWKELKEVCLCLRPEFIVNTAAYTNVDDCEDHREDAWRVNVKGVENLARASRILDSHLLHFSTDYIFDGKNGPYSETDTPNPIGYYGKTKLASENVCRTESAAYTIFRTNVLYGATKDLKSDFVLWTLGKLREGLPFNVVDDQFGNPTLIDDIAYAVGKLLEKKYEGIFNIGGADWLNRYEFSRIVADVFGYDKNLISPSKSASLRQKAPRPMRGGLITLKAESMLDIRFSTVKNGLSLMRQQLLREGIEL